MPSVLMYVSLEFTCMLLLALGFWESVRSDLSFFVFSAGTESSEKKEGWK